MTIFLYILALAIFLICGYLRISRNQRSIAFFHPYCNDGGGGERVLWKFVDSLIRLDTKNIFEIIIFTGDRESPKEILASAYKHFGISIDPQRIEFIYLRTRFLLESKRYPVFTLLLQSMASIIVGAEALWRYSPEIYLDTMGYSFTTPLVKVFAGSFVGAYVHYPTISMDMLQNVISNRESVNNRRWIANNPLLSKLKLCYMYLFVLMYRITGYFLNQVAVNSSWTKNHIQSLWRSTKISLMYPPCDIKSRLGFPIESRQHYIVSIAQFRPEKNHILQIEAFNLFLKENPDTDFKLVIIGSCRKDREEDSAVLKGVQKAIQSYQLENHVIIRESIPRKELDDWFKKSMIGIHTMTQEHFGIGIVELMASGLITIAHNSGGPKEDIVVSMNGECVGFLAVEAKEYADILTKISKMKQEEKESIQKHAKRSADRFSDDTFEKNVSSFMMEIPSFSRHYRESYTKKSK